MSANWLQMLTQLIEETQDDDSEAAQISLRQWMDERDQLRWSSVDVNVMTYSIYIFPIPATRLRTCLTSSLAAYFARITIPRISRVACSASPIFTPVT